MLPNTTHRNGGPLNLGNQVYSKNEYSIIQVSRGFVIINRRKKFLEGHTHIKTFKTAKYLIDLAIHDSMPYNLSLYLLTSLTRITENESYKQKILDLITNKKNRGLRRFKRSA